MTRIAILGQGAWGSALAATLAAGGNTVIGWRRHDDPSDLGQAELVLSAVPAQATRQVLSDLAPHMAGDVPIVLTAKGLERETMKLQSDVAAEAAPGHPLGVLTGPSFADDLAAGQPTAVTLACAESALGERVQQALATPSLRPYLTDDVIGAQVGGALKNVMAIACGAAIGAGLGESARAALMTRGFAELTRLGTAMGARAETLGGLSGLGDLALTTASEKSRNFAYGFALGRGATPAELAADGRTYEGATTAPAAQALARRLGQEAPITDAVAGLVAGDLAVAEAFRKLMHRPLKRET
ncbi:MAG TPA: NAD(P)H-dependent glycerol-3-phosphate dehydrogenase [Thermohalobaculum sp.]|nr:NAD(P)H-dependent glycerol-3-phosphate dehydrogenase [Thermohalobaculum sp.]